MVVFTAYWCQICGFGIHTKDNMNNKFLSDLEKIQLAPPENIEGLKEPIIFFSWKLFSIKKIGNKFRYNYEFDTKNADLYIDPELNFLAILKKNNIKFRYLKLIPDELPIFFWNKKYSGGNVKFASQIKKYFQKIYPKTEVLLMTNILKDPKYLNLYSKVYRQVNDGFAKNGSSLFIKSLEFEKEVLNRSTYYSKKPLSKYESRRLAKQAFALFAAESAVLYELGKKELLNIVMLVGKRSTNTYKYEFFKHPKDRPVLPKLFVI